MSSDVEEEEQQQGEEKPFAVERAKTGRAKCKKCKCTIEKDEIRIGKYVTSFFADGKLMPAWHHVTCMFEAFAKQRATTKRIDDPAEDVKGWEQLSDDDRKLILDKLEEFEKSCEYHVFNSFSVKEIFPFFTPSHDLFVYSVTDLRFCLLSKIFHKFLDV